jgi:hypothetical protein
MFLILWDYIYENRKQSKKRKKIRTGRDKKEIKKRIRNGRLPYF